MEVKPGSLTVKIKPAPYLPEGAGPYRDAMLAIIESVPEDKKLGYALALSLDWLETLGRNAMTPTEKRTCLALVDVFRPYVPADIQETMDQAKKAQKEKRK